jgi:hypothetical protein
MEKNISKAKVLVAYYSKGGNTRAVAEKVAKELNADIDEIRKHQRSDEAIFNFNPRSYDLVIVGTPVNGFSPSKPVADYLVKNRSKIRKISTYLTYSLWPASSLKRLSELASMTPVASAVFMSRDIKLNHIDNAVKNYAESLKTALRKEASL